MPVNDLSGFFVKRTQLSKNEFLLKNNHLQTARENRAFGINSNLYAKIQNIQTKDFSRRLLNYGFIRKNSWIWQLNLLEYFTIHRKIEYLRQSCQKRRENLLVFIFFAVIEWIPENLSVGIGLKKEWDFSRQKSSF